MRAAILAALLFMGCGRNGDSVERECVKSHTETKMVLIGKLTTTQTQTVCDKYQHFAYIDGVRYRITAMELAR